MLTVQEQQRQSEVVLRIRQLRSKYKQNYGLKLPDEIELTELQIEANENNWFYW